MSLIRIAVLSGFIIVAASGDSLAAPRESYPGQAADDRAGAECTAKFGKQLEWADLRQRCAEYIDEDRARRAAQRKPPTGAQTGQTQPSR